MVGRREWFLVRYGVLPLTEGPGHRHLTLPVRRRDWCGLPLPAGGAICNRTDSTIQEVGVNREKGIDEGKLYIGDDVG